MSLFISILMVLGVLSTEQVTTLPEQVVVDIVNMPPNQCLIQQSMNDPVIMQQAEWNRKKEGTVTWIFDRYED
ncbi:MAG: hypothetical protein IAE64_07500 [Flavobacteriales bacterium]|nr:MAG: hypothetical protein UZ06_CHB003001731 [Chlorobi bacterium OLB6]MBE2266077.1 hypothetical protein [Flavobacteriales bacterium]MBV6463305.1 hypothetical protein [Chlorobiota bacterium]MBW7853000.1 hypothetical protein [Candidatus Kapabacteria bacterium]QOJ27230.1 MAG: hypothetical protein HRU79_11475 [Ignavibacteria bacterium]